jgi:hypothetical protein
VVTGPAEAGQRRRGDLLPARRVPGSRAGPDPGFGAWLVITGRTTVGTVFVFATVLVRG